MGTASTMASLCEALGVALPGNGALPAVDSRRAALAHMAGRRIVELVHEDVTLSRLLHPRRIRECYSNQCGDRWIDQRHHPSDRHRRPCRCSAVAR